MRPPVNYQKAMEERERKQKYRLIHTQDNSSESVFRQYVAAVHRFFTVPMTTKLFNARSIITKRYKTEIPETSELFSRMRKDIEFDCDDTGKTTDVLDVGSGDGGIVDAFDFFYNMAITTMDIDPAVTPDIVADVTRVDQYANRKRPRIVISRYSIVYHHSFRMYVHNVLCSSICTV